ncbi:hypothetical protein [Dehalococcoides mccartyi]|uniref:hypothetical protein n=1 Tax=Dehalococcoides mccartyi TaxID=61435 RepID=UPI0026F1B500|nr:hypothetical protein [Dehalococcoides mccartyi]
MDTLDFSVVRFQEAVAYRKISLRKMNIDPTVNASDRTIRRAKKDGRINPEILDRLGKYLDVDPLFLSGEYDKSATRWAKDEAEAAEIRSQFHVEDFPYILQEKRKLEEMQYIKSLLIKNEITIADLEALPKETSIHFYLDLERAISKVLWQYFKPRRSSIHNYSIPMPPEDEIISI